MRPFCLAVGMLFVMCSPPALAAPSQVNSLHAGALSLQLQAFSGGYFGSRPGIWVKAHVSDRTALLLGTNLNLQESSGRGPVPQEGHVENHRNYSINVSSEVQRYLDDRGPVTVFLSLGPYWGRYRSYDEGSSQYMAADSTIHAAYTSYERRGWAVGATAGVGFEWFFRRTLSVLGRVGASMEFGRTHVNQFSAYDLADPSTYYSNRIKYSTAASATSSAALGLAVYF